MIIFGQAPEQELPGMDFDVVNQQKVNFTGKIKIAEIRKGVDGDDGDKYFCSGNCYCDKYD